MKKTWLFLSAAMLLTAAPAHAQTLTRTAGTPTNYSSIESEVFGKDMVGMKVSSMYENCSTNGCTTGGLVTASGFWQNLGGGFYGANLYNGQTLAGVVKLGANTNTFNGDYTFDWFLSNDFRTLKFEGGSAYGNVLFDIPTGGSCGAPSISCAGQTNGSSTGNEFDIQFSSAPSGSNLSSFNGTVNYRNYVTVTGQVAQYDLFTTVEMTFATSLSGPDNDQTPFKFNMDTDLGVPVTEPGSLALVAAGLMGLAGMSRRRRAAA